MIKIELEDRVIYRAESGKKLKVKGKPNLYSEIICKISSKIEVKEVEEDGK